MERIRCCSFIISAFCYYLFASNIAYSFDSIEVNDDWHKAIEDLEKNSPSGYKFSDYPVKVEAIKSPKKPILNKFPQESAGFIKPPKFRNYRTTINRYLRDGMNFAGHYTIARWGCGTACEDAVIVDVKTGNIYGYLNSHLGLAYKENSRLLVNDVWVDENMKTLFPEVERSYWLWGWQKA